MVSFTILAGGFTSFIVSYSFNSDKSSLTVLNQSPTGPNPSWISLHPTNKSILYATNENTDGAIQSFGIGANGALIGPIAQASSTGNGPAYVAPLSSGQVAAFNYGSGDGIILPTSPDPLHFDTSATPIKFPANPSHPHQVYQYGSEVFVPDLGADKIWRLVENGSPGSWKIQGYITQPAGSGPRHIAIRKNTLYTLHELSSTLTQQSVPPAPNGTSTIVANLSTLPPTFPSGSKFAAAEILVTESSSSFPSPYIYVSNRNVGNPDPAGDTIAIFALEPKLTLVKQVYTGLNQIRSMQFGGPENKYLVAAGVAGTGGTIVLERVSGGADLKLVARNTQIPTRSSFVWLN